MLSDLAKHLQPEGTTSDALPDDAVDIEMLDYKFIEQCTDIPLLEKIIDILKYLKLTSQICTYNVDLEKKVYILIWKTLHASVCIHWTPRNACKFLENDKHGKLDSPYNTLPNNDEMTMIEADLKVRCFR